MLGPSERREPVAETEPAGKTLTYCNTCLEELARNGQNRQLVEEILRFRRGETGSAIMIAAETTPTATRRHSPDSRALT